jgi:carboxypeptidase D
MRFIALPCAIAALLALSSLTEAAPFNGRAVQKREQNNLQYLHSRKATAHANYLASMAGATGPAYPSGVEPSAGCTQCKSSLSFSGTAAAKYAVGTQIPSVPFKTKNSWAGNVPVSGSTVSKDASLFFWLWGKDSLSQSDSLVVWLNGGPGCSSLGGMVQENGPFLYESVLQKPYVNPYSWTRAADILYVEQPVQTGFTTGKSQNTNEDQVAEQFASFLDNFFVRFPELKSRKLYITGESYAGTYIPYITNYLYERNGGTPQLKGAIIIDGVITETSNQEDLVAYQYAVLHQTELKLTNADVASIKAESDKCNLSDYVDKNLKYPPVGRLPDYNHSCSPWNTMYTLASTRNPTFDVYNIDVRDPSTTSPLGNPNGGNQQYLTPTFFDNYALQTYIHAPHKKWVECATVFVNDDDTSGYPDATPNYQHSILANVIEKSKSFLIMNGNVSSFRS